MSETLEDISSSEVSKSFREGNEEYNSGHLKGHGIRRGKVFCRRYRSKASLMRLGERIINDLIDGRIDVELAKVLARVIEVQKSLLAEKEVKRERIEAKEEGIEEVLRRTPENARLELLKRYLAGLDKKLSEDTEGEREETTEDESSREEIPAPSAE